MNYVQSFLYALEGLAHALQTERNTRLFTAAFLATLVAGGFAKLTTAEWPLLIFSGIAFLAVELINTALERFVDAFHTHSSKQEDVHYHALKATKDVAAAAALLMALGWATVVVMTFLPYVLPYIA